MRVSAGRTSQAVSLLSRFDVLVERLPDHSAYLAVDDQGRPTDFNQLRPGRERGRGLALVTATTWGTKGDATGRTVWAVLPPPSPSDADDVPTFDPS